MHLPLNKKNNNVTFKCVIFKQLWPCLHVFHFFDLNHGHFRSFEPKRSKGDNRNNTGGVTYDFMHVYPLYSE